MSNYISYTKEDIPIETNWWYLMEKAYEKGLSLKICKRKSPGSPHFHLSIEISEYFRPPFRCVFSGNDSRTISVDFFYKVQNFVKNYDDSDYQKVKRFCEEARQRDIEEGGEG